MRTARATSVGPYYEDFTRGMILDHELGRTITETDNVWFTLLTLNTAQAHFNSDFAAEEHFGRPLVNSCLTLALVTGITVRDISQNGIANLGWDDVKLVAPVFVGDTIYARTEVLDLRVSSSRPAAGVIQVRTEGYNQSGDVVITFNRSVMLKRRADHVDS